MLTQNTLVNMLFPIARNALHITYTVLEIGEVRTDLVGKDADVFTERV